MTKEEFSKFFNEFFVPFLILILTMWAFVFLKSQDKEWQEEQIIINECLERSNDKNNCQKIST